MQQRPAIFTTYPCKKTVGRDQRPADRQHDQTGWRKFARLFLFYCSSLQKRLRSDWRRNLRRDFSLGTTQPGLGQKCNSMSQINTYCLLLLLALANGRGVAAAVLGSKTRFPLAATERGHRKGRRREDATNNIDDALAWE